MEYVKRQFFVSLNSYFKIIKLKEKNGEIEAMAAALILTKTAIPML